MSVIFELKDISYAYPHSENVLCKINLQINAGESVAILGANGCGKSTLLKIFAGLIYPDSGEFSAFGNQINSSILNKNYIKLYHQKIGFIFQDSDIQLFCSSVYEELAFGLLQLNLNESVIHQRIEEITTMLNITHLLQQTPFKLSGGEKKKVAIAAVLLLNPDVIILDEPTNALDPKTQHWLIALLKQLNLSGKTLIISTHNLHLVSEIANRGVLFNEQHAIVADDDINQLILQDDLLRQVNFIY